MASVYLVAALLHLLFGMVAAVLVRQDASLRGSDRPLLWAAAVLVAGVAGVVGYALVRGRIGSLPPDSKPPLVRRFDSLVRAVAAVFAAFLAAYAVAGLGSSLLVAAGVVSRGSLGIRVALSVLQFVGFGVGVAGYMTVTDDWDLIRVRVPSLREFGWVVGGVVGIVFAAAAVGQLLAAFGIEVAQNQVVVVGQENPRFFLYMIPVSLFLVGPFEELVFRGTVQGLLRRTWGGDVAIVVASVMFGVVHWIALTGGGTGRVPYVAIAATLGLVLGFVYERTQNLVVPAAVHGVYNSVLFGIQYAVATGLVN
ncbi:lysostaphin resistance A-like protein [Salinirarus marinus]|uniref:CPBP family intramembrane glutamic endopeptidase n=1 Tax=Salinirarus marinus TaxID=3068310 RepID=UPI003C6C8247